jgi:hypothetical protein
MHGRTGNTAGVRVSDSALKFLYFPGDVANAEVSPNTRSLRFDWPCCQSGCAAKSLPGEIFTIQVHELCLATLLAALSWRPSEIRLLES